MRILRQTAGSKRRTAEIFAECGAMAVSWKMRLVCCVPRGRPSGVNVEWELITGAAMVFESACVPGYRCSAGRARSVGGRESTHSRQTDASVSVVSCWQVGSFDLFSATRCRGLAWLLTWTFSTVQGAARDKCQNKSDATAGRIFRVEMGKRDIG